MVREGMRGDDQQQNHIFSYLSPEMRVRKDHPLRAIRAMVDEVLTQLSRRFDMMYALEGERGSIHSVRQSDLRRVLGVTAGVVSRMVRALEELGLVTRQRRLREDRRQWWVTLTERGRTVIRTARRMLLRGLRRFVFEVICFGRHKDWWVRVQSMDQLEGYLDQLRMHLGDRASLDYPWGRPDD